MRQKLIQSHGGVLVTGLPPLACSAGFLRAPRNTSPRVPLPTVEPSPSFCSHEDATGLLTGQSARGISSVEVLSSKMTLAVLNWLTQERGEADGSSLEGAGFWSL